MGYDDGLVMGCVMGVIMTLLARWIWIYFSSSAKSDAWKMHRKHWHRLMRTRDVPYGVMLFAEDGYRLVYDNSWLVDTGKTFTESGVMMPILEPRTFLGTVAAWSKRMFARRDLSHRR